LETTDADPTFTTTIITQVWNKMSTFILLLYSAHIHSKNPHGAGVYIEMYRVHPCRGFKPGSSACQHFALTTRLNPCASGEWWGGVRGLLKEVVVEETLWTTLFIHQNCRHIDGVVKFIIV
jgi:hypothetical protein